MTSRGPFQRLPFWDSGTGPNSAFCVALRKCLSYPTALIPHFCWGGQFLGLLVESRLPKKNLDYSFTSPKILAEGFFIKLDLEGGLE